MLWNSLDKMVDVSRKKYGKNGVETIADNDEIQWLNEKNIEEGLNRKKLWATTLKYLSDHRKHRYELADEPKNNPIEF